MEEDANSGDSISGNISRVDRGVFPRDDPSSSPDDSAASSRHFAGELSPRDSVSAAFTAQSAGGCSPSDPVDAAATVPRASIAACSTGDAAATSPRVPSGGRARSLGFTDDAAGTLSQSGQGSACAPSAEEINLLPDELLQIIISYLPYNEAVRTRNLSTRWSHLWAKCSLCITEDLLKETLPRNVDPARTSRLGLIKNILSSNPSLASFCYVPFMNSTDDFWDWEDLVRVLVVERQAEQVELSPDILVPIPQCILTSRILKFIKLKQILLPAEIRQMPLCLVCVELCGCRFFSDKNLEDLVMNCPLLNKLSIWRCTGLNNVVICSKSLRLLEFVSDVKPFMEQIYIAAPNLLLFGIDEMLTVRTKIKLKYIDMLQRMGCINTKSISLKLETTHIEAGVIRRVGGEMSNLTCLGIMVDINNPEQNQIMSELLALSPNLQSLLVIIRCADTQAEQVWKYWEFRTDTMDCLTNRLVKLSVEGYKALMSDIAFLRFLILRARVLRSARIEYSDYRPPEWIHAQLVALRVEKKASEQADIEFVEEYRERRH